MLPVKSIFRPLNTPVTRPVTRPVTPVTRSVWACHYLIENAFSQTCHHVSAESIPVIKPLIPVTTVWKDVVSLDLLQICLQARDFLHLASSCTC